MNEAPRAYSYCATLSMLCVRPMNSLRRLSRFSLPSLSKFQIFTFKIRFPKIHFPNATVDSKEDATILQKPKSMDFLIAPLLKANFKLIPQK
jgi:hypothetical protein